MAPPSKTTSQFLPDASRGAWPVILSNVDRQRCDSLSSFDKRAPESPDSLAVYHAVNLGNSGRGIVNATSRQRAYQEAVVSVS